MKYLRTAAHRKWAEVIFTEGFQAAVAAAYARRAPCARAYRWFAALEDADVVRQWVVDCEYDIIDIYDPDTELPLFVGGDEWEAFVAEAMAAGVST